MSRRLYMVFYEINLISLLVILVVKVHKFDRPIYTGLISTGRYFQRTNLIIDIKMSLIIQVRGEVFVFLFLFKVNK